MADDNTSPNKPAKKPAAKATTGKATASKAATKKQSAAANAAAKNNKVKKSSSPKLSSPSIAKAAASKDEDMQAAARKISELDKANANAVIKPGKSSDDLKSRAHAAKKRAQQKILEKSFVSDKPTDPLERLANTFDNSARRWEMVVYPSMFAFVLLAGYGFFLIYRLTHDIAILSQSVTHMAVIVSDAMPRMTKDLGTMTGSIDNMTGNIDGMSGEMSSMSNQMNTLTPMSNNIKSMTHNIGSMNRSVYGMQRDMHGMNRTVSSGPFGMMNDMMPFSSKSNVPPAMQAPNTWPTYSSQPSHAYVQPYPPARMAPVKPPQRLAPKTAVTNKTPVGKLTMPGAAPVSLKQVSTPASSTSTPGSH